MPPPPRQEELERQAAENKPVLLPKQTIEDAIAAAKAAYSYKPYDPNAIDPLLEKEPEYVQRQFNYTPLAKRPKVKVEIVKAPAPQNDPLKPQKAQSEVEPS